MRGVSMSAIVISLCAAALAAAHLPAAAATPFIDYLGGDRAAMVAYSPVGYDPRPAPHHAVPTRESIRADLEALRRGFDGLVLYGYDHEVTPTIVSEAVGFRYRAVLM